MEDYFSKWLSFSDFLGECTLLSVHQCGVQQMVPSVILTAGVELCDAMGGGCGGSCKTHTGLMTPVVFVGNFNWEQ